MALRRELELADLAPLLDLDVLAVVLADRHIRIGRVIEEVWRDGGRFDGWSEHFSYERWVSAATAELEPLGVSLDWFNMLYQVLLGQEKGPRFGSFVATMSPRRDSTKDFSALRSPRNTAL